jgi:hypothetical protein
LAVEGELVLLPAKQAERAAAKPETEFPTLQVAKQVSLAVVAGASGAACHLSGIP